MGQLAAQDGTFWPGIDHITFAAEIANSAENLEYMTLADHKFKSGFFRAGSNPNDPIYELQKALLKTYLQTHAQSLFERTNKYIVAVVNDPTDPHREFKLALLQNILLTPWCTGAWDPFFVKEKTSPFSVNLTLDHYVPNAWVDDNLFFRAGRLNGKKDPED
ncbi:hypothetical protein JR316_0012741 [Psilocybe cubensis]|uniref:Uncharacterized protein n=1 Tax=Psilocybe cubensis TaxID=181762 RepID=A0ACB8GKP1_PSICU|nr:hypothetical protein JR316_0012741 [Psilocybe cubensis]KAH9475624.1 hypothetical protein JR316_0012741 [Psilocybe cubensis]